MALIKELDTGTPIRIADRTVSLVIDGQTVTVPEGTSVMAAASMMGTQIPKLCATDMLEPFGSCRLCLVEIEGRQGHARLLHHACRGRHGRAHADAIASPSCARA